MAGNLIQRRIYVDTMRGGKFHLEMTENLSALRPVRSDDEPKVSVLDDWRDEETRALYEKKLDLLPIG